MNELIYTHCLECNTPDSAEHTEGCEQSTEVSASDIAWDLVDGGNLQYRKVIQDTSIPTASEWVSAETITKIHYKNDKGERVVKEYTIRNEYLPPIHLIVDGMDEDLAFHLGDLASLDDETQKARETNCPWCALQTPKQFNDCQNCERPLESNVR